MDGRHTIRQALDTPWKVRNEVTLWAVYPCARLLFALHGIAWGKGWRIYGLPIIQKHRDSQMRFGSHLQLRSSVRSNPLSPNHPVVLATWQAGAMLQIGNQFGMGGGTICAAQSITIGHNVTVGANSTIMDTDFHPVEAELRRSRPREARSAALVIEDDVFIGMQCLILKGTTLGRGCVVGAGSVVTQDVPAGMIVAGNPAKAIGPVLSQEG